MPCYVFTPPLLWVADVVLLATTLLFSSEMPTSTLTFRRESGPGYWVPHQWRHGHVACPLHCCVTFTASDKPSSLRSAGCVCWLALQKLQVFLCHHASSSQHALGLGFTAERALTLTSLKACTQTHTHTHQMLLRLRVSFFTTETNLNVLPDHCILVC